MQYEILRRQAEAIEASNIPSTASSFELTRVHIGFPTKLGGKRVLEIGSGVSPVIFELAKKGASVIGIDTRYADWNELLRSSDEYIENPNQASGVEVFKRINGQKGPDELEFLKTEVQNRESFIRYFEQNGILVAGNAGDLPIASNSIDFAYSINTISPGLIKNPDVYIRVIYEAHRILAPNGEFQLYPFYLNLPSSAGLIGMLKELKIKFGFKEPDLTDMMQNWRTLRIFK